MEEVCDAVLAQGSYPSRRVNGTHLNLDLVKELLK